MNVLRCPDYTSVGAKSVNVSFQRSKSHTVIDSTGLGEGEWKVRKHGKEAPSYLAKVASCC
jgi:hypothetical protein